MSPVDPPVIEEYLLRLDIDFARERWAGTVSFEPPNGSDAITLDSDALEILGAVRGSVRLSPEVRPGERAVVLRGLASAKGPVEVRFTGQVAARSLVGLYRSRIPDGYVLTSQCEPTGARRIFPCLDRPDRRARFRLTVRTDAGLEVIANAPVESVTPDGEHREWRFAPTPSMASYLFYLAVGRFDRVETNGHTDRVRVFTPPGRGASGAYAAEVGTRLLAAYEEYYGIPYPLAKLDLVAVSEHAFGAMENWGAISFRDMRLLIDAHSASHDRRDVFETISHEVAHQWFGNLVTMAWWNDIWLNESFAAFLETKITDQLEPSLGAPNDYFLRIAGMQAALNGDSLRSTHPVRAPVERPEELSQIFDEISYGKGASLIAMLEGYLGDASFRRGVTEYLERFRYSNARTEDLWESLERVAGEPVRPLITPWTDRPGLPVVTARLGASGLELRQDRFTYHGRIEEPPWPIPIVYDVDGRRGRLLLDTRTRIVPVPAGATVHLNPGAVGFYRVHYDPVLFDRLLASLPRRPAADRWIVLEDLYAFLVTGDVDWATCERAVRALASTPDRLVVESVTGALTTSALLCPEVARVQELARGFLADQTERIGIDPRPGEPTDAKALRERVTAARVRIDGGFARDLAERFVEWDRLDPDIKWATAIARIRSDGRVGYREVRRALESSGLPESETFRLERALAWTPDPDLALETLDLTLTGRINLGHVTNVIVQTVQNPDGRRVAWPWLKDHLVSLAEMFRGAGFLTGLLEYTTPYLGLDRAEEVRAYYRDHPFPEGARGLAKGLERLELAERLRERLTRG